MTQEDVVRLPSGAMATEGPAAAHVATIDSDLPCGRCAYNLRGLTAQMTCPECGTPVSRSLQGNWLSLADPDWLNRLRLGVALKLWGMLAALVVGLGAAITMMAGAPPSLITILGMAGGLLGLLAVFLITSPEPTVGSAEDPINLRKVVRASAVVGFAGGAMLQANPFGGSVPVQAICHTLSLAGVVAMFGEFVYLRRFARRIPNPKLAQQTTTVMWGMVSVQALAAVVGLVAVFFAGLILPAAGGATPAAAAPAPPGVPAFGIAFAFVGCFFGLTALVFTVMYVFLLVRYYRALKEAMLTARTTALTIP